MNADMESPPSKNTPLALGATSSKVVGSPFLGFRGLIPSSAPWVLAHLLWSYEVAQELQWTSSNEGELLWQRSVGWNGEFNWYRGVLLAAQYAGLVFFFVNWTRVWYFRAAGERRIAMLWIDRRIAKVVGESIRLLMLSAVFLGVVCVIYFGLGMILYMAGAQLFYAHVVTLAAIPIFLWICCRLATLLPAKAISSTPIDVTDCWTQTNGNALRILVVVVAPAIVCLAIRGALLGISIDVGIEGITKMHFRTPPAIDLPFATTAGLHLMIAIDLLIDLFFYTWLFAALAEICRHMSPRPINDDRIVSGFS
jgi:hypothetical protein